MGANSKVVAISFSPPEMLGQARERAKRLGFKNSFSAYVTKLVEDDIAMHDAPANSGSGLSVAGQVVTASGAHARAAASAPQSPATPVKYKIPRKTKLPPKS